MKILENSRLTSKVKHGILFCLSLLLSPLAFAQAGSSLPIVFDSADAFFDSVSSGSGGGSGLQHEAMVPRGLLRLPQEQRYVFWIELEQGRLKVLERQQDGGFMVNRIIPVSIGANGYGKQREGDKKTPVGVYHFTSFLRDSQLLDYYGFGAYPLNYPNAMDLLAGKTGSGIWLHGLPKNVSERPLLDSDGCVVIDNDSLLEMANFIEPGNSPVIMSEGEIEWVPLQHDLARSESLAQALDTWRRDWESLDNDRYLSWYADDFSDLSRDLAGWSEYKRRVNNGKSFVDLSFSNVSFITDPQDPDIVVVRYYQDYSSSNYRWRGWKLQLWQQEESGWRILYEGNA